MSHNISSQQLLQNAQIALLNASNKVIEFILHKIYAEDCLTKVSHLGKKNWNYTFEKTDKFNSIIIYDILFTHERTITNKIKQQLNEVNNNAFNVECKNGHDYSSISIFW